MTDNEIIKALECIAREEIKCAECAYGEYCYPVCQNLAGGDALDLINRQKAEIERLKYLLDFEEKKYTNCSKRFYKEAVKDFAKRLKETKFKHGNEYIIYAENIDNLVKEMIGEQE